MQETKKRICKSLMDTKGMDGRFTIDRISNLPCNVIDDILKYLPLRDAVRTSILSRGWQYKWRNIPHLVFDLLFKVELREKYTIESVIYQVLLLHKGPIVKFEYSANIGHLSDTAVYQCLHFLSNHRIEELKFNFSIFSQTPQMVPHHLFNFDHLKHLYLLHCRLKLPSVFKGFDRLVTLEFSFVTIESGGYTRFISKCPMLDNLKLKGRYSDFQNLEIDAPNLKCFCLVSRGKPPSICLKSTSILEQVSITLQKDDSQKKSQGHAQSKLIECFGSLSSIRKFELHLQSLRCLARSGVPDKLPNSLGHISVLGFGFDFLSMDEVRCAICLIRSSPNMQSLILSSRINLLKPHDIEPSTQFLKEQHKSKLTLSHLKNVEIDNFSGSKPEMEFVKLILSAATGLKKLELKLGYSFKTEEGYSVFKRLARFRRASSKAKIFTKDCDLI